MSRCRLLLFGDARPPSAWPRATGDAAVATMTVCIHGLLVPAATKVESFSFAPWSTVYLLLGGLWTVPTTTRWRLAMTFCRALLRWPCEGEPHRSPAPSLLQPAKCPTFPSVRVPRLAPVSTQREPSDWCVQAMYMLCTVSYLLCILLLHAVPSTCPSRSVSESPTSCLP